MKILVCWDLFMSHTCFPDVIHQKVWGPRVDRRSGAYVARLHKIQETYDTLQSELLRNMEVGCYPRRIQYCYCQTDISHSIIS